MTHHRFDRLANAVVSRRSGVGAGLAVLLGIAAADVEAKHKKKKPKKCKPACGPCQQCAKGRCKPKADGTACGSGDTCQGGVCSGGGGCGAGQQRCGATCIPRDGCCQDGESCNGTGDCLTGVCRIKPVCEPKGTTIPQSSANGRHCCSQDSSCQLGTSEVVCTCMPARPGDDCLSDSDCATGTCVGYRCRSCAGAACGSSYRFVRAIGSHGSGPGQFHQIVGLAANRAGNLLVVEYQNYRVQEVTPQGQFVRQFGVTGVFGADNQHLGQPYGVAVDKDDNVYIADQENARVQKFSPTGTWLHTFGVTGVPGSDNQHLSFAQDVAIDSRGYLYIADYTNSRVQVFTTEGAYAGTITRPGLGTVQKVEIDRNDHLWVRGSGQWHEFDANGHYVRPITWWEPESSSSLAISPSGSYFHVEDSDSDHASDRVVQYSPDGQFIRAIDASTEPGAPSTRHFDVNDLTFDRAGNLYLGEFFVSGGIDRILIYEAISGSARSASRGHTHHHKQRQKHQR